MTTIGLPSEPGGPVGPLAPEGPLPVLPREALEPSRRASGSFWHAAWYRYRRNYLAVVSGVIVVLILLVGLLAPLIAPYNDASIDLSATLSGASWHHWLGTDELGRDTLTRVIWGDQTSMKVAIGAPIIGLVIGLPIGIVAGWFGGIFDWVALRFFELFQMVPTILAALLFVTVFGVSVWKLALFIGVTLWVGFARLARAQYIALRHRDFVQAARAAGVPTWRIIIVHILPNAVGPMIVYFVQQVPYVIFTAAGFSFIGLGVQDPLADWGKMINDGVSYLQIDALLVLVPVGCIGLACLSFSFLGDGLRDALDPTSH
ncbi:MAG TPA: ABC transporter permease [Acidimicrobiales bacterium]|nr:ABC transporter permease [Acidimicrobiales bacterium]